MATNQHVDRLAAAATELVETLGVRIVLLHGINHHSHCTCGNPKCPSRGKHPRHKDWPTRATNDLHLVNRWLDDHPRSNLGWIPGPHLLVVDIDPRHGGILSAKQMQLTATRRHYTGGHPVDGDRGQHAIYRIDHPAPKQGGRLAPGVDFKTGNGSLLVAPNSVTDQPYTVANGPRQPAPCPPAVLSLLAEGRSGGPTTRDRPAFDEPIPAGGRDETLTQYAGRAARKVNRGEWDEAEARLLLEARWSRAEQIPGDEIPLAKVIDRFEAFLTRDTVRDEDPDEEAPEPLLADGKLANDIANAERLVNIIRGRVYWVGTWQTWVVYDGSRWVKDPQGVRTRGLTKQVPQQMRDLAARLPVKQRDPLRKWANATADRSKLNAAMDLARDDVDISHDEFNRHPHLLNVANGTLDLQTNDLLPANPDHLLTTRAPVEYNPDAECPKWLEFLATVQPDEDARRYLQKAAGSGLTGDAVQKIYVHWGEGANGKGTFFNTIADLLGRDYYRVPHASLIVRQQGTQHDTVKAALFGSRTAVAGETQRGDKLNEAQIKELTGGDVLEARAMREDPWAFNPTWTLHLHTNHKPKLQSIDESVRRRMVLVPWTQTIPRGQRNDQFRQRVLVPEASGILNWLLEGCALYMEEGLNEPPSSIEIATEEYLIQSDTIGRWFLECGIECQTGAVTATSELQRVWALWCEDQGLALPPKWQPTVTDRLRQLGGERKKQRLDGKVTPVWVNVVVSPSSNDG